MGRLFVEVGHVTVMWWSCDICNEFTQKLIYCSWWKDEPYMLLAMGSKVKVKFGPNYWIIPFNPGMILHLSMWNLRWLAPVVCENWGKRELWKVVRPKIGIKLLNIEIYKRSYVKLMTWYIWLFYMTNNEKVTDSEAMKGRI